jgi:hypothetical protein
MWAALRARVSGNQAPPVRVPVLKPPIVAPDIGTGHSNRPTESAERHAHASSRAPLPALTERLHVTFSEEDPASLSGVHLPSSPESSDGDAPEVIRFAGQLNISSDAFPVTELPPLASVNSPDFTASLLKKLEVCSLILDCSNSRIQIPEKAAKRAALTELVDLFDRDLDVRRLTPDHQTRVFQMLQKNIFEQDPSLLGPRFRVDYSITVIEHSWGHMNYCFQILNRFVRIFPDSPLMTFSLAQAAMNLTQLPDMQERMQFTIFLRGYHDTHPSERSIFLTELARCFGNLNEGVALPFCGAVLISLFGYIVSRAQSPMAREYALFYLTLILPLIGSPQLTLFAKNLSQLISSILPNNPEMVMPTMRALEKYWPATNGDKQMLVLEMLITICAKLPPAVFAPLAPRLFVFLAACLASPHYRVVGAVLDICINAVAGDWIHMNSKVAIPELVENMVVVSEKYWAKPTAEKATTALSALAKVDKALYHKIRAQQKQMKGQRQTKYLANDCQRYWYQIADTALDRFSDFNLNAKKHQMYDLFHNEKPETRAPSHFVSGLDKPAKQK